MKPKKIYEFKGEYRFLSNFVGGVEQKYQAAKCANEWEAAHILKARPGEAKRMGRRVKIRPDWDEVKLGIMEKLVREKFSAEPFKSQLLATGDLPIEEGNSWGDTYWGVDLLTKRGANHLGRIIMAVRAELRLELNQRTLGML